MEANNYRQCHTALIHTKHDYCLSVIYLNGVCIFIDSSIVRGWDQN